MVNLPNVITFLRLLAVPLTIYSILVEELTTAFWLFVAAGISDALDGAIARFWNMRTVLGGYLDPLADKALLVSVYLSLAKIGLLPLWLVVLVVFRDLLIVGGVLLAFTLGQTVRMRPLLISKLNTLTQLTLAGAVLGLSGLHLTEPMLAGVSLIQGLAIVTAVTTTLSGAAYILGCDWLFRRDVGFRNGDQP